MRYFRIRVDFLDGHDPLVQRYGIDPDVLLRVTIRAKRREGGGSNQVGFRCMHVDDPRATSTTVDEPNHQQHHIRMDLVVHAPNDDVEVRWTTNDGTTTHYYSNASAGKESVSYHRVKNHVAVTVLASYDAYALDVEAGV